VIAESDFTPAPLYVYLEPAEGAKLFRKVADWLDEVGEKVSTQ
jgi:hypothetical protein